MSDETRNGRRNDYPFVMIPQWVLLLRTSGGLSAGGFMVYCLLLAHVNSTRGDGKMWVTQENIGKMLDMHPKTVGRLINGELSQLGLVDVATHRYGDNNSRKRNVYTIHEIPDDSFSGYRSLGSWHRANAVEGGEPPTHILPGERDLGSEMNPSMGMKPQVKPHVNEVLPPEGTLVLPPGGTQALPPEGTQMSHKQDETKTRLLPPPPSSVGLRRDEGEDGKEAAPAGPDNVEITSDHLLMAKRLYGAVPWPSRMPVNARKKKEITERLAMMAACGWDEERVREYISGQIPDWSKAKSPMALVASVLQDCPLETAEAFTESVETVEDVELAKADEAARKLEAQYAQQKLVIADCIECDDLGYVMPHGAGSIEWHGHGKMSLSSEMRKTQAAAARMREERETGETPWETGS